MYIEAGCEISNTTWSCKDGSLLPVLLSATAIKDEADNYLMSRANIVYDITARVQAEAALEGERQRLFQVLEQLPAMCGAARPGLYGSLCQPGIYPPLRGRGGRPTLL